METLLECQGCPCWHSSTVGRCTSRRPGHPHQETLEPEGGRTQQSRGSAEDRKAVSGQRWTPRSEDTYTVKQSGRTTLASQIDGVVDVCDVCDGDLPLLIAGLSCPERAALRITVTLTPSPILVSETTARELYSTSCRTSMEVTASIFPQTPSDATWLGAFGVGSL